MSLFDGKYEPIVPKKKGNNRDEQRNDYGFDERKEQTITRWGSDQRRYGTSSNDKYKSSYSKDEHGQDREDRRVQDILKFVDGYMENIKKQNFRELQDVTIDFFPNAVKRIGSYYSSKNSDKLTEAMNKLVNIAATESFSKTLSRVLDSKIWMDDDVNTFNNIWRYIGFLLSITLENCYSTMHEDTISVYVNTILPRLWDPEIKDIVKSTGVTKDLALDLSIAIPLIGTEFDTQNIKALYGRFLDKMLVHADDNANILNYEIQGLLFERVFGKTDGALKVIGQYLISEPKNVDEFESEVQKAVYKEFVKMLYTKLDNYDIGDIAFVFRFVAKFRKEHEGAKVLFSTEEATKYENVRKGLLKAMEDKNAMTYLA